MDKTHLFGDSFNYGEPDPKPVLIRQVLLKDLYNPGAQFQSQQVFVRRENDVRIPMTITGRKGRMADELDGSHPTLLFAYGGTPWHMCVFLACLIPLEAK